MLADKKKELIPSVESGEGLKSLMGLEAHVRYANNFYNVSVDCESPAQSKYLIQKYAHRYDNSLFQIYPYVIERLNDNKVKIGETGLFLTKKEISLHALLKDFTEEEHMVIQSGTERFANKYNLEVAESVEAVMPRETDTEKGDRIL